MYIFLIIPSNLKLLCIFDWFFFFRKVFQQSMTDSEQWIFQINLPCIQSDWNIFEWTKLLERHLHQIQEKWAGRNIFINTNACEFTAHCTRRNVKMNLKSTTNNGFWIINSLIESWGYAWPGLTVSGWLRSIRKFMVKYFVWMMT